MSMNTLEYANQLLAENEHLKQKVIALESDTALGVDTLKNANDVLLTAKAKFDQVCADNAALTEQVRAQAAENIALKSAFNTEEISEEAVEAFTETAIMDHHWDDTGSWSWVDNDTDVIRAVLAAIKPETPATDAVIRELQAHELDCAADELMLADTVSSIGVVAHLLRQRAARLRTGEVINA